MNVVSYFNCYLDVFFFVFAIDIKNKICKRKKCSFVNDLFSQFASIISSLDWCIGKSNCC